MGIKNTEITGSNCENNQSILFKIYCNNKSILFLGDTGIEIGNKLLQNEYDKLQSDIVQMSHHGQQGVDENFYKIVNPEICLFPTPEWLYNNDGGSGEDTRTI